MSFPKLGRFFALFAVLALTFDMLAVCEANRKRLTKKRLKFCKLDNFFECQFEQLAFLTHQGFGTGIADNDEEYEQFCFSTHDYIEMCGNQWLRRCGNQVHRDLFNKTLLQAVKSSIEPFCDRDGPIRKEFLRHVKCTNRKVKIAPSYRADCLRKLQGNAEFAHENAKRLHQMNEPVKAATALIRGICCVYNEWEACIVSHLSQTCGPAAGAIFPAIINHGGKNVLKGLCEHLDHTNPKHCPPELVKAPADFVPKGLHSSSLVSYIFSYNCPNVGWGIDLSRDF